MAGSVPRAGGIRGLRRISLFLAAIGLGSAVVAALPAQSHGAVSQTAGTSQRQLPDDYLPSGSWASWQHDLTGSRYAAGETTITPGNVGQLTAKWAFTFPRVPGVYPGSQPAVVGNTLYVGSTDAKFYALNATTGATRWAFDLTTVAGPATASDPNPVRDGPAVADGIVYFGDSRGYLYAVDASTGQLRWATRLEPTDPYVQLTGSPIVYAGKVFIGLSDTQDDLQVTNLNYPCCTARGDIVAVNAYTGAIVWRHYTVPVPQPTGTWPSGATEYSPSGVSVWDSPVIDPQLGTLFIGTGQNYTGASSEADSVLALNVNSGQVRWSYQAQPDTYTEACNDPQDAAYCLGAANGTDHDWDFGASPNLFQLGGTTVLGIGEKSGIYRAFNAVTGQLLWSDTLNADASTSGGNGGIQWGSSYDGHSLYVATWYGNPGTLYALDPATGAIRWQTPSPANGCSTGGAVGQQGCALAFTPAVTSSPGLVFEGSADGKMYAFSSATGALLWSYDTVRQYQGANGQPGYGESLSGLGGAVVANGMVYVQSGYYPLAASTDGTVLIAFGLPGVSPPA